MQKCLRKDPDQRFQTARELCDELDRWRRGEPIVSRPISTWERTVRWAKREPIVTALIAAVISTVMLGFVLSTFFLDVGSATAASSGDRQSRFAGNGRCG